jgi:hypothetical protein
MTNIPSRKLEIMKFILIPSSPNLQRKKWSFKKKRQLALTVALFFLALLYLLLPRF